MNFDIKQNTTLLRADRGGTTWWAWVLGGLIGLSVPSFLALVGVLGRNIPQDAIGADYLAGVLWAVVLALGILVAPVPFQDRRALLVLWGAKCFVTLGFMLVYEYTYGLDSYMYFEESIREVRPSPELNPDLGGGTETIAVLAWYHARVLPESFHALKVSFSMVGLIAVYLFYRAVNLYHPLENAAVLYFLGLFPSILFWSSVLGKDPLVLLGIALYAFGTVGLARRRRLLFFIPLVGGVLIAMAIRTWLGPILLLPLLVIGFREVHGVFRKAAFLGVLVFGAGGAITAFREAMAIRAWQDL
ncbi:MAG: hypothetical protein M3483_06480 [Gemmatimonadota bacterium]|nr:hypothetical protein [Gemmatimonadota bacterium]